MLNLPLRPQVLFLSLLPPHLLVCRAEQALGSWRLCLLLQTAAEGARLGSGSAFPCFPWLLKTCSSALETSWKSVPVLCWLQFCAVCSPCSAGAQLGLSPAVFSPGWFSSGLLMSQSWMFHSGCVRSWAGALASPLGLLLTKPCWLLLQCLYFVPMLFIPQPNVRTI